MNSAKLRALPIVMLLFPLDLFVACVILIADLISFPLRFLRHSQNSVAVDTASVTVQILNWNGLHLLREFLPSVVEAIGGKHEIVVVDNGSQDGSVDFVRERFPDVRLVLLDRNHGFSIGNNLGFKHVRTDVVVLLNNDMLVSPDFLQPLLAPFSDANVFAVTSQIFLPDPGQRREETGKTRGQFEQGFFRFWHDEILPEDAQRAAIPVLWAGGGSCAMDMRKLGSIGGFDSLYYPFYVEDTDVSWQAWKRGWKCLLAPQSRVVHKHRGTSRPIFGDDFVDRMIRRNQYLFIWKNVTAPGMVRQHLCALPRIHGSSIIQKGARFELRSYAMALVRLPMAVWRRMTNIREYPVSDCDVVKLSQ